SQPATPSSKDMRKRLMTKLLLRMCMVRNRSGPRFVPRRRDSPKCRDQMPERAPYAVLRVTLFDPAFITAEHQLNQILIQLLRRLAKTEGRFKHTRFQRVVPDQRAARVGGHTKITAD